MPSDTPHQVVSVSAVMRQLDLVLVNTSRLGRIYSLKVLGSHSQFPVTRLYIQVRTLQWEARSFVPAGCAPLGIPAISVGARQSTSRSISGNSPPASDRYPSDRTASIRSIGHRGKGRGTSLPAYRSGQWIESFWLRSLEIGGRTGPQNPAGE
jgi:hypothetical protein